MQRESFVFYRSFAEVMNELSDEDAGKLIKIISAFALDGSVPELSGMLSVCFKLIKPQIEANNKKYLNGCKGGRPKKETIGFYLLVFI